jgi:hypothetical protein
MKALFTIHAGEYLVGSQLEKHFKSFDVWLPSKDTGIDLLLTNPRKPKRVGIQVKFSKDFLPADMSPVFQQDLLACGWWTINAGKIRRSKADFWVFALYSIDNRAAQYVIIKPKELLRRLKTIYGSLPSFNVYLWVTKKKKCWETRSLNTFDKQLLAKGRYVNAKCDMTRYLNDWKSIRKLVA